ncbi:hypothetical protein GCM10027034_14220 [Ramlibacter solisilvae]|uniref:hypothetical protein n=1 Tax=Ramlibacter tataouinensis TaxID=94132 RepID=UPI0011AE4924|nr:hypothetical protein [Ramlibacter tataouinensis]
MSLTAAFATYPDGSSVAIGDQVLAEGGKVSAVVRNFIVTPEELAEWNVEEAGVMLESPPFGLLFIPASFLRAEPLMRNGDSS